MDGSLLELIGLLVVVFVSVRCIAEYFNGGAKSLLALLTKLVRQFPGVNYILSMYIEKEVVGFVQQLYNSDVKEASDLLAIPEKGIPFEEVLEEIQSLKQAEVETGNKVFAYKYMVDPRMRELQEKAIVIFSDKMDYSERHQQLIELTQSMYMNENALNPVAFPSLRKFELECVAMTAWLLNAPSAACGSLTSGGTESILMAVKAYRDLARKWKPHITKPEVVAPISIHPAFEKAAYYFGVTIVHTELNDRYEADVKKLEESITPNTILIAASAPAYPHGIIDPIEDIGLLAQKYNIPYHVDACYGGFMLPWLEKIGDDIPKFDFRCRGVTSMSADLHKFGYTPKGASVVVYINEDIRKHQLFTYTGWPGGLFGSTTMAGTRSGSVMAAAWATLRYLGQDGYISMAKRLKDTVQKLTSGVKLIKGLEVIGFPLMNCFAIKSNTPELNILVLADEMEKHGWRMERQQLPDSLHFSVLPQHSGQEEQLLSNLKKATKACWGRQADSSEVAAMYGMIGKIPDQTIVDEFITEYFSKVYIL